MLKYFLIVVLMMCQLLLAGQSNAIEKSLLEILGKPVTNISSIDIEQLAEAPLHQAFQFHLANLLTAEKHIVIESIVLRFLKPARQFGATALVKDLTHILADSYQAQGHSRKAYDFLQTSVKYSDSLFRARQASVVDKLEQDFELAEKDRMLAQAQQLKTAQALRIQTYHSWGLTLLIGLIVLAALYFWWRRLQQLQTEKQVIDLQQRLLRSQMNPHFAFNTLASIQNYLLQSGKAEQAAYYLDKFSELMQQILEQSSMQQISLAEELATLRNYLSLQQLRYEHKFKFELQIATQLDQELTYLPPMLIQPLIENAIEHGKVHTLENGSITIDIQVQDKTLQVLVRDNGLGIKAASLPRPAGKPKSVGTSIIKERLQLLARVYGAAIGYHVFHPKEGGTEVSLRLPFIYEISTRQNDVRTLGR